MTIGYLVWSLLPVLIAALFSFNDGRSRTSWQGFSMRWYFGDPERSVWHDDTLQTALLQTLKLGRARPHWSASPSVSRSRSASTAGTEGSRYRQLALLLSFVIPETLLAVALLLVVTQLALPFTLGTTAQVIGLVTFQLSYPAILVRARLPTIGNQLEEAAMDLGASPLSARAPGDPADAGARRSWPAPCSCSPT